MNRPSPLWFLFLAKLVLIKYSIVVGVGGAADTRFSRHPTRHLRRLQLVKVPRTCITALTQDPDYAEHLKQLLLYHVVGKSIKSSQITDGPIESLQGEDLELTTNGGIKVNEANVIEPFDIKASNGRIHTVDSVLLPSFATSDIVDIATTNENFSILAEAVVKAGLVDALRGAKLTVLAPTNQAFIDAGIDLDAFEDEDPDLINILQYHVIPGIVVKEDVPDGSVVTLSGDSIDVSVKKSKRNCGIVINESTNVILADVLARYVRGNIVGASHPYWSVF